MFINQLIVLPSKDEAEVVKSDDRPFDLTAIGEFNDYMTSVPTNPIEKLILNINLSLHHDRLPLWKARH